MNTIHRIAAAYDTRMALRPQALIGSQWEQPINAEEFAREIIEMLDKDKKKWSRQHDR